MAFIDGDPCRKGCHRCWRGTRWGTYEEVSHAGEEEGTGWASQDGQTLWTKEHERFVL